MNLFNLSEHKITIIGCSKTYVQPFSLIVIFSKCSDNLNWLSIVHIIYFIFAYTSLCSSTKLGGTAL